MEWETCYKYIHIYTYIDVLFFVFKVASIGLCLKDIYKTSNKTVRKIAGDVWRVFLCKNQQALLRPSVVLKVKDFSDMGAHRFSWGSNDCCNWVLGMVNERHNS